MRVAQKPHVEDEIGVPGQAPREAERHDRDRGFSQTRVEEPAPDSLCEIGTGVVAGVNQARRPAAQWIDKGTLPLDPFPCGAVGGEGVATARFIIAPGKLVGCAVKEQDADVVPTGGPKPIDQSHDRFRIEVPRVRADADGKRT